MFTIPKPPRHTDSRTGEVYRLDREGFRHQDPEDQPGFAQRQAERARSDREHRRASSPTSLRPPLPFAAPS